MRQKEDGVRLVQQHRRTSNFSRSSYKLNISSQYARDWYRGVARLFTRMGMLNPGARSYKTGKYWEGDKGRWYSGMSSFLGGSSEPACTRRWGSSKTVRYALYLSGWWRAHRLFVVSKRIFMSLKLQSFSFQVLLITAGSSVVFSAVLSWVGNHISWVLLGVVQRRLLMLCHILFNNMIHQELMIVWFALSIF